MKLAVTRFRVPNFQKILYTLFLALPTLYFINVFVQVNDLLLFSLVGFPLLYFGIRVIEEKNWGLPLAAISSFILTILWGLYSNSVPVSDFELNMRSALDIASGKMPALLETRSAGAALYYAAYAWLLGPNLLTFYIASSLAWFIGTCLIYQSLTQYLTQKQSRTWALLSFLSPVYIVYGAVVSSEAVMYLAVSAGFFLYTRFRAKNEHVSLLLLGLLLGMAYLTRPHAIIFLLSMLIVTMGLHYILLTSQKIRIPNLLDVLKGSSRMSVLVATFLVPVLLYGSYSYTVLDNFRLSTNQWGSLTLLMGANKESSGQFNFTDKEIFLQNIGNDKVLNMAISRIMENKSDFAKFALTEKVDSLWGYQKYAYYWSTDKAPRKDYLDLTVGVPIKTTLKLHYAASMLLFLLWLVICLSRERIENLFVLIPIYGFIILHLIVEVQPRYHLFAFPILLIGAAIFLSDRWQKQRLINLSTASAIYDLARSRIRYFFNNGDSSDTDLSWKQFSMTVLAQRNQFKGIYIQERNLPWHGLYQRMQHISIELGKMGYLVIYKTKTERGTKPLSGFRNVAENVWITNKFSKVDSIENAVRSVSSSRVAFLDFDKSHGKIIFEYADAIHPEISGDNHRVQELMQQKNQAFNGCVDYVIATSRTLYDEAVTALGTNRVLLVPNGVDPDHFRNRISKQAKFLDSLHEIKDKHIAIVGFYGSIGPWLWHDEIAKLAQYRSDLAFIFIGPDFNGGLHTLPKRMNVFHIDRVEYDDLPTYAAQFDICIIPFRSGKIARATSPVKLFEFFALEKPVVVTSGMVECTAFPEIFVGDSARNLSIAIDEALKVKDDTAFKQRLAQLADENSWAERARVLSSVFKEPSLRDD